MTRRQELRQRIYTLYSTYDEQARKMVTRCPWCQEPIEEGFDLHEYLVKRSAVPLDKQDLIMVPENLVPVHHDCHMKAGQSVEMTRACLYAACRICGASDVGRWYASLWQEHGLSVRKGLLVPVKRTSIGSALNYFGLGCDLWGFKIEPQADTDEVIGMAITRWRGHDVDSPDKYQGIPFAALVRALVDGYWLSYLLGVAGLPQTLTQW